MTGKNQEDQRDTELTTSIQGNSIDQCFVRFRETFQDLGSVIEPSQGIHANGQTSSAQFDERELQDESHPDLEF